MAENIENINAGAEEKKPLNFVQQFVAEDLAAGKNGGRLNTRFPPEPNGYLHIGHAKAICMDFGVADKFGGTCNLRFDDTNPQKEDTEYVEAIMRDIHWLGFDWGDRLYYASDYFPKLYDFAIRLIKEGKAYVDDQTSEQIARQKGTPTSPGTDSPYRNRTVEENLDLFQRMNAGEFEEGSHVLRAKIDMASSNMHFRDPIIYRIIKTPHWRTGNKWNVYPMYDFAHGQSDYFEGVTHSICTLEFVPHRDLYDYFVHELAGESASEYCPRQIEFNRLNLTYTVMSKRKLLQLVKEGLVAGWDAPRMPTLCGLRRRGYTHKSIRDFCERIGVSKVDSTVDWALLESCLRDDLNAHAKRVMAVLRPVKLTVTNYPEGQSELLEIENNPLDPAAGTRQVSFSRHLWIENDDFMEVPAPKYKRLHPGFEVRLKGAYLVTCTGCVKDENGNVTEILCEYDPESRGGDPADGRKVKGATIHWVDADHCAEAEVRLYSYLFSDPEPDGPDKNFLDCLNPDSLEVLTGCKVEQSLAFVPMPENGKDSQGFQFMRQGYFCLDNRDAAPGRLVFNRSVALKDSFKK